MKSALLQTSGIATLALMQIVLMPTASYAQATPAALPSKATASNGMGKSATQPSVAQNGGQIQDIVVTAQRRSENLENVPISAQVISGRRLQEQNYTSLQNVTQVVPGVKVVDTGSFSNSLYMRGIGSGANAAFDQSVATFVDDVYHGRSRLSDTTFLDLSQVEVLKGPQTSYFGNNAIAGALNLITTKPSTTSWNGYGRVLYGSYRSYAAETAAGGPVTDWLAVRVAGAINGQRGWVHNVSTGDTSPDSTNYVGRATFLLHPTEDFDATFKIEGSNEHTTGTASGLPVQEVNCPAPLPIGANAPSNYCGQFLATGGLPQGLGNNLNTSLPGQESRLKTGEEVLTMNYRHWGQTFTSVTGFSNYTQMFLRDTSSQPVEQLTATLAEHYHQFSQEVRVASPTGGRFEYLAGVYYQHDRLAYSAESPAPFLNALTALPGLSGLAAYLPVDVAPSFNQGEDVKSVFGSLTWNATARLKLTAALRGTWVDKSSTGTLAYGQATTTYGGFQPIPAAIASLWGIVLGAPGTSSLKRSDSAPQPSFRIQYDFSPGIMAYAKFDHGFKAGGINGQNGLGATTDFEYGPEKVNAYEVGFKGRFFDNHFQLNADVFRMDYSNLQVFSEIYHPTSNVYSAEVGNAGRARSQGVEAEIQWIIVPDFRIGANLTYLDSRYLDYSDAPPITVDAFNKKAFTDLSGTKTEYAPSWSGSVNATYTHDISERYRIEVEMDPYLTTHYYTHAGDPFFRVPGYVRLDGRISFGRSDSRWTIDIIGKNLTDRIIVAVPGVYTASKEEPRSVSAQLRVKF